MKKVFSSNKGITLIDLTVGLVVLALFVGVIVSLMTYTYKTSLDIQKSANAMSYATIVFEKVDEKAYEDVDNDFISKLKESGEIQMNDDYALSLSTSELEKDLFKKVELHVDYKLNNEKRTIILYKLKIKELYKE